MPLLTWQLWLAKDVVREIRLPWQKPLSELTPLMGCTIDASTFNQDWDSHCCSQTSRKLCRMAIR
jgi:hypothetical protein